MTDRRLTGYAFVAFVTLAFAAPVLAQEEQPSKEEDKEEKREKREQDKKDRQEERKELREADKDRTEPEQYPDDSEAEVETELDAPMDASPEVETEDKITEPPKEPPSQVIDEPPRGREYDRAEETDQEAEAEERVPGHELHPEGEDEMMADHPVEQGDIAFRPGKGVEINSADDKFQLRIRVRVQFLYTLATGDIGPLDVDDEDEARQDLRIRRARFIFQGHAFGKDNKYKLEIDPLRRDNVVLDYYLDFTKNKNASVRIGQYKLSSNRQRVISSGNLQMVDRSRVNAEFTLDRDIGIDLRSRDFLELDRLRYVIGVSSGNGLNNFQFNNFALVYLFRIEYLPLGIFRDYTEVDFARTGPRLSMGSTYAFFQDADRVRGMIGIPFPDGGTANYHFLYWDALFKVRGFSALSEFALRTGVRDIGPITEDPDGNPIPIIAARNGVGWMLQAGYLLPNTRFEFAGRGSIIRGITTNTSLPDGYGATFSISWYFFRHPMKIQADVSQLWEEERFLEGSTVLRIQLQASL